MCQSLALLGVLSALPRGRGLLCLALLGLATGSIFLGTIRLMIILLPKGLYVNKFDYGVKSGWAKDNKRDRGKNNLRGNGRDSVS